MIFLFWCFLHAIALLVMSLLTPRRSFFSLSFSECLIVLLWYAVPLSGLLAFTDPSPAAFTSGFALYASGAGMLTWARRVNPFFAPQIVMPLWKVTSGPYRWLSHPGYLAMSAMALGSALMVSAPVIGYLALAAYLAILTWRAREENRLIQAHIAFSPNREPSAVRSGR